MGWIEKLRFKPFATYSYLTAAPGETALEQEPSNGSAAPTTEPAQKPAANPFRKDPNAGTNPFNQ